MMDRETEAAQCRRKANMHDLVAMAYEHASALCRAQGADHVVALSLSGEQVEHMQKARLLRVQARKLRKPFARSKYKNPEAADE